MKFKVSGDACTVDGEDAKMDELLSPIVIGGIAGFFIGSLIKWILKMVIIIGVLVFLFFHMAYTDVIDFNLDGIVATMGKYADVLGRLGFTALASNAPFVGSFFVGLFLGLRR